MPILRKFTTLLLLLVATLALSVPAAASIAHESDHEVGAEVHFHFAGEDQDGSADQDTDRSNDQGVDHGHPPFSATDPGLLNSSSLGPMLLSAPLPQDWSVRELKTLSWIPQKRPPKA